MERALRAETLRLPYETLQALKKNRTAATSYLKDAKNRHERSRLGQTEAFTLATQAADQEQKVEAEQKRLAPDLDLARRLDAQIDSARALAEEAQTLVQQKRSTADQHGERATSLSDALDTQKTQVRATEKWLGDHATYGVLAAQWPRWETELSRYVTASHKATQKMREAAQIQTSLGTAASQLSVSIKEHKELSALHQEASRRVESAKENLFLAREEVGPEELEVGLERLSREQASLMTMQTIARETKRLKEEKREIKKACAIVGEQLEDCLQDIQEERKQKEQTEKALEDTAQALERHRAALDLGARREELLVHGEPCPLCGSVDHPASPAPSGPPEVLKELTEQQDDLKRCRQRYNLEIQGLEKRIATHQNNLGSSRTRLQEIDREVEAKRQEWAARRESIELVWVDTALLAQRGVSKIGVGLPKNPSRRLRDLEEAGQQMQGHAQDIRSLLDRDRNLSSILEAARTEQDTTAQSIASAEPELRRLQKQHADFSAELLEAQSALKGAEESMASATGVLEQPLGTRSGWNVELSQEPEGFLFERKKEVQAWEEQIGQRDSGKERCLALGRELDLAMSEANRSKQEAARSEAMWTERQAKLDALMRRRETVLSGQTVRAVQDELLKRQSLAHEAVQNARNRLSLAGESLAAAEEHLLAAEQTEQAAAQAEEQEEARMRSALGSSEFSELSDLADALRFDPDWLVTAQKTIVQQEDEITEWSSRAVDRRDRLSKHEEQGRPSTRDKEVCRKEVDQLQEDLKKTVDRVADYRGRLVADDKALRSLTELGPAIKSQRDTLGKWSEISSVIGSRDGRKLRTIAQGLTLDLLLGQANLHLTHLRPRYRLERVPNYDMELQVVDGDMGEEIRPVSTLSGGETFLVSLALALGLSSLSSRNVQVESLFVDEGFGHLDRQSLDIALATLDQLQAQGRTVGLISHVPDIAERIGYRVVVEPEGPGLSQVHVVGS